MKILHFSMILVALSALSAPVLVLAEPLGRLFFTQEERRALEQQRQPHAAKSAASATLNGRVVRSSGRNTAWVNGVAMDENQAPALRPGETASGANNERKDLLNGGSITLRRAH